MLIRWPPAPPLGWRTNPSAEPVEGLCGKKIVLSVAGADVSAESLCLAHWGMRHGLHSVKPPVVSES
jgi:hypothetical protein